MEKNRRKEKILAVILFGFSWLYLYGCWRLKLGALNNPGPGFIPLLVGILLWVCTGVYLYNVYQCKGRVQGEGEKTEEGGENLAVLLGILASIIVYPFILEKLNFILSTMMVIFVMLVLLNFKNAFYSFFLSFGITVISFLIFAIFLGVSLPSGILEEFFYRLGR